MSDVRITLTPNPGLSKDEILKILASYDTITPEAIRSLFWRITSGLPCASTPVCKAPISKPYR